MKNNDNLKEHTLISVGSRIAFHREDGRLWMRRTITDYGDNDHNGSSYRIWVLKRGRMLTITAWHVKTTLILAEQYLRAHMPKQSDAYMYRDNVCRHFVHTQKDTNKEYRPNVTKSHVALDKWASKLHITPSNIPKTCIKETLRHDITHGKEQKVRIWCKRISWKPVRLFM